MSTYIKNLETGKIELHFAKSDYMSLPEESKKKIKSNFLFSRFAGGWVSRSKDPNLYHAIQIAKELNLTYEGEKGEKLSFAEQVETFQEKAAARAQRFEQRAEKAQQESKSRFNNAMEMIKVIPPGQPILVGHHSERGHRRLLEKHDNNMRKGFELEEKADYYEGRAEAASYNASDAKFKDVKYLLNRIAECKKHLRTLDRYLNGIDLVNRETYRRSTKEEPAEISEKQREHWTARVNEWNEKLEFFQTKLEEAGGGQMTAERLKEMKPKFVKVRGEWWPLKSINRDTVTVLNWLGIAHFTWKFKFDLIKSVEAGYITEVLDRDGNKVEPTIKYK